MNTTNGQSANPFLPPRPADERRAKMTKAQRQADQEEQIRQDEQNMPPEIKRQQDRIKAFGLLPKTAPPYRSLRECLLANLRRDEIELIQLRMLGDGYQDAFEKVMKYELYEAYKSDIRALGKQSRDVGGWYHLAATSRSPDQRPFYKHMAVVHSIWFFAGDAPFLAELEAREIAQACVTPTNDDSAHTTRRL